MAEAVVETPPATESLGWRAGLTGDLQKNDTFKDFKGVSDLATDYLSKSQKVTELEGKLNDYVPKLPDDATDEEKALYFDALGRPEQASEYEFEGEDKNAPEWTNFWKSEFHGLGLTKAQAKGLSAKFNGQIQKMVEAHNNAVKAEMTSAEQKLRSEMGDKFDTNVELAKRMWTKYGEGDFDKAFEGGNSAYRFTTIKMLLKFAQLTGEDKSPHGGNTISSSTPQGFRYDKSPAPPPKRN